MKILYLDIETAPNKVYTWGLWNQNIGLNQIDEPGYTLCWAAKWAGETPVYFASVHHNTKEEMLRQIYDKIDDADVVVHYNGTKFDMPILMQEFMGMGWSPPASVVHIDMLKVVRKQFRMLSNKLDYVAGALGIGNKVSHKGMALWLECMQGCNKAWKDMKRYNIGDVHILEKLYIRLLPWIPNHPNYGLFIETDDAVCPSCSSSDLQKRGLYYTPTMTYQRFRCNSCGSWSKSRTNNLDKETRKRIVKGI